MEIIYLVFMFFITIIMVIAFSKSKKKPITNYKQSISNSFNAVNYYDEKTAAMPQTANKNKNHYRQQADIIISQSRRYGAVYQMLESSQAKGLKSIIIIFSILILIPTIFITTTNLIKQDQAKKEAELAQRWENAKMQADIYSNQIDNFVLFYQSYIEAHNIGDESLIEYCTGPVVDQLLEEHILKDDCYYELATVFLEAETIVILQDEDGSEIIQMTFLCNVKCTDTVAENEYDNSLIVTVLLQYSPEKNIWYAISAIHQQSYNLSEFIVEIDLGKEEVVEEEN